ncbi:MAG: hypothetical protein LBS07_03400, partial [Prevotellaceae bacterium]|nr:hypothetical protein [Prevotellaceae bacterium]
YEKWSWDNSLKKELDSREICEYDSNMNLTKRSCKDNRGRREEVYKNGLIVEKSTFDKNGEPESISYYTYYPYSPAVKPRK